MTNYKMNRREFIHSGVKAAGILAVGGAGLSVISSCASMQPLKQEGPVSYPKLSGRKIQSPEHYGLGQKCMVGLWLGQSYGYAWVKPMIEHYNQKIGKPMSFYLLPYKVGMSSQICAGNDMKLLKSMYDTGELGIIPFITFDGSRSYDLGSILNQVIAGKCDSYIRQSAVEYKEYGEKYGGFFIRMFREMNLSESHTWAGSPGSMKKAWIHVWNIFEAEGANEYATWVFNPYASLRYVGNWQTYYPGDKYVDWFGLNGYSVQSKYGRPSFYKLFAENLIIARRNHPTKPMMLTEIGYAGDWGKKSWQRKGFSDLMDMNFIKGIGWWSENWKDRANERDMDTRIDSSPSALEGFREGISDPYFLGTVPYQSM